MGPATYLSKKEESKIVQWIIYLGERGFAVTKNQLLDVVRTLIIDLQRQTPFKDHRPGRHWYEGFIRRHPEIIKRVPQTLSNARAAVTENNIRNWFNEVRQHLDKLNLLEIDPSRVYNCDETAFLLSPKENYVLVKKGSKAVHKIANDDKKCLTTLFMVNAAGMLVPPMVMFWYKQLPYKISRQFPSDWTIGLSEKGWMTAESFEFISNNFYQWLINNNIQFPVLLYVDGHSSHLKLPLVTFCRSVQIELVALYPNATHILQPLDVSVFRPLKNSWKKEVLHWRLEHEGNSLGKEDFASVLEKAIKATNLKDAIKNGFKHCGLMPFSADAISYLNLTSHNGENTSSSSDVKFDQDDYKTHLKIFEDTIGAEVLQKFKIDEQSKMFSDKIENYGLFFYWLEIKRRTGKNTDY